tara:strand:+ start:367 stop:690 length:324 start_codon:yes stop_codon:yes gene_type:complete
MTYTNLDIEPSLKSLEFRLINTNRYWLRGAENVYLHIATIRSRLREFIVFLDVRRQKAYCEEITTGNLHAVHDDSLFNELIEFVTEKNLLTIQAGAPAAEQPFAPNK